MVSSNVGRYECVYSVAGLVRSTWFDTLQEIKNAIGQACDYDWLIVHTRDGQDDIFQGGRVHYLTEQWINPSHRKAIRKACSRVRGRMVKVAVLVRTLAHRKQISLFDASATMLRIRPTSQARIDTIQAIATEALRFKVA